LVDISVVVLEAIHRHRQGGLSDERAALEGTNSVAVPALAATLTTVAVLLPVLLLLGLAKKLFAPLALTVACAMFAGYLVSMLLTPLACRYFLGQKEPGKLGQRVAGVVERVANGYSGALARVLPYRKWLLGAVAILVGAAVWTTLHLPS